MIGGHSIDTRELSQRQVRRQIQLGDVSRVEHRNARPARRTRWLPWLFVVMSAVLAWGACW